MRKAHLVLAHLLAMPLSGLAQETTQNPQSAPGGQLYLSALAGQSALILGSEERFKGGALAIGWARAEPRFHIRGGPPAQLMIEGMVATSHGGDPNRSEAFRLTTLGIGVVARYRWIRPKHISTFVDLGWGLAYNDRETVDLDTNLNSSPSVAGGFILNPGKHEILVGLRFQHLSNAGTNGPNQGQNFLVMMVSGRL